MALENGRLTKKQKKANAFRDRKGKKKEEVLDVPEEDGQESTELGVEAMDVLRSEERPKKKGKKAVAVLDVSADGSASPAAPSKKRKREAVEVEETIAAEIGMAGGVQKKKKKKKASDGDEGQDNTESTDKARRLILFVGNLRYVTSREAILGHFSACDPPPTVRLLTPKQSKPGATVTKSKGCAFLEFASKSSLQQALKLHHSELDGRKINVELTAGGGGKGDGRLAKLQKRNKELNTQRAKRLKQSSNGEDVEIRSQRFSTTSGEGDAPRAKHTWTVGDTVDEETHRGGKNVKKRGKRKPKDMGTGVNAIPVG